MIDNKTILGLVKATFDGEDHALEELNDIFEEEEIEKINPKVYIVVDEDRPPVVFFNKKLAFIRAKHMALLNSVIAYENSEMRTNLLKIDLFDSQLNILLKEYGVSVYEVFVK